MGRPKGGAAFCGTPSSGGDSTSATTASSATTPATGCRPSPAYIPPLADPFAAKMRVAFPTRASLHDRTDPYYRPFDMNVADVRREAEWAREFDGYVKSGKLPALELVRLSHDHLGSFESAEDGVNTPDTQIADNDYALGLLVEKVSRSPYWKDTVIVALEDDAQNGSDHVDAHRSFVLLAGGHVKRGGVVSTPYATPSVLRTIELLLGGPLRSGRADALAPPMSELFDEQLDATPFVARVPAVLRTSTLVLPGAATVPPIRRRSAAPPARRRRALGRGHARAGLLEARTRSIPRASTGRSCAGFAAAPRASRATRTDPRPERARPPRVPARLS